MIGVLNRIVSDTKLMLTGEENHGSSSSDLVNAHRGLCTELLSKQY